jgi:hypothetical protein
MFIVKHYLASRSYLTFQNEFRDKFPNSPMPNKSTISRLVNRFRDTGSMQVRNRSGQPLVLSDDTKWGGNFKHLIEHCFLFSDFNIIYFLTNRTCVRNRLHEFWIILYNYILLSPADSHMCMHACMHTQITIVWMECWKTLQLKKNTTDCHHC